MLPRERGLQRGRRGLVSARELAEPALVLFQPAVVVALVLAAPAGREPVPQGQLLVLAVEYQQLAMVHRSRHRLTWHPLQLWRLHPPRFQEAYLRPGRESRYRPYRLQPPKEVHPYRPRPQPLLTTELRSLRYQTHRERSS